MNDKTQSAGCLKSPPEAIENTYDDLDIEDLYQVAYDLLTNEQFARSELMLIENARCTAMFELTRRIRPEMGDTTIAKTFNGMVYWIDRNGMVYRDSIENLDVSRVVRE